MTMMAYAAIYVIWGSTYLAIRIAVGCCWHGRRRGASARPPPSGAMPQSPARS